MKKGSGWPAVRARWAHQLPGYRDYRYPVWIWPQIYGIYTYLAGPLPIPVSITPDDIYWGSWRYVPSRGSIRWEGDWDATAVWGRWAAEFKPGFSEPGYMRYGMTFTDVVLGTDSFLSDFDTVNYDNPSPEHPNFGGTFSVVFGSFPDPPRWVTWAGELVPKYADIYNAGLDQNDTSPVTWSAPDDPW